jgi:hypothetical protein
MQDVIVGTQHSYVCIHSFIHEYINTYIHICAYIVPFVTFPRDFNLFRFHSYEMALSKMRKKFCGFLRKQALDDGYSYRP